MKVKVDIFSGFLGAGKTKLIKKLIEENYYGNEKIAIIENEFGEVSIDGAILRNTNTVVREINSGCICCQVTGDFKNSILEVIENYKVDRLLIEPTGVAKLSELRNTFNEVELKDFVEVDKLITVVDSEKFDIYLANFRNFYTDQIKVANQVVLSRVQKVDNTILTKLVTNIKAINSKAIVVSEVWDSTRAKSLISTSKINNSSKNDEVTLQKANYRAKGISTRSDLASSVFQTFALNIDRCVSKDELIKKFNFISNSSLFGKIIRAKGIVKMNDGSTGQFDFTLNEFSIESVNYGGDSVISFIGTDLNKDEIIRFFL